MIATNMFLGNGSFKLKRPLITTQGFVTDPDPVIKNLLDELNTLLSKKVFTFSQEDDIKFDVSVGKEGNLSKKSTTGNNGNNLLELLKLPIGNKHAGDNYKDENQWPDKSIEFRLYTESESPSKLTISECIDKTGDLASLKYDYQSKISERWSVLDFNTQTVLDYEGISDYLIAYAYLVRNIQDVNGLLNFILGNIDGVRKISNYGIVSAARYYIFQEKINVHYQNDNDVFILNVLAAKLPLSNNFKAGIDNIVNQQIYSGKEIDLIKHAHIGNIPQDLIPQLVRYIKNSPVPIDSSNINYFLPLFITQLRSAEPAADTSGDIDLSTQDNEFEIERFVDDRSTVQISTANVECAAQLFYSMTLGDELDIFNVVNFFTHKYMVRGNIQILDNQLRDDLQMYVFSNKFTDVKSKKILDRTRFPERQMFYRQVFSYGNAQTTDDVVVNKDFPKLWRILITESAKYLERAQESPNPDMYVSRQTVMQAVEDLQYNLSTSCTGMATVITPIIYKELNFVIKRIFMHPEIMRQVVPAGGSWWKVVETLYTEMKQMKPRTTVLNNKANLGYDIIKSIANYNPATFEDDSNFSDFISNVDAYIITQAQLQEDEDERRKDMNGQMPQNKPEDDKAQAPVMSANGNSSAKKGNDEWDF